MVCGTGSDVGKTHLVTGLCRALQRRDVKVAPFKAQNMALNSYVTPGGEEIGRAQAVQAMAAGVTPEVAMNPILLKPTGERTSQVVVMGHPVAHLDAAGYQAAKTGLLAQVLAALEDLRQRFDVVVLEGAGSAAEINLLDHDIVNLRIAAEASLPALVVGDIDRGGVFAALYGTVSLLPDRYRRHVRGFVINKFRGDPALLRSGLDELRERCGVPVIGVVPMVSGVALDAEDSLALPTWEATAGAAGRDTLDVAVIRFPRLANFTDFDALALEPGVSVRLVADPPALAGADLVVLPGTKSTVADLDWLRHRGLDEALAARRAEGTTVLGICGGYQMLGRSIVDHVESGRGAVSGLGWLAADTEFGPVKQTRQRRGRALGEPVEGYQIHHGVVTAGAGGWMELDDRYGRQREGASSGDGTWGTTVHGLFEADGFRSAFLQAVAERRGKTFRPSGASFAAARQAQLDRLGDLVEAHLDMEAVLELIGEAAG